jgi:ABC-type nitrate/sulfonate/bicarbonate transport system permease component
MSAAKRLQAQLLLAAGIIVLWEVAPPLFDINRLVLPRFSEVIGVFGRPATGNNKIWYNTLVTTVEVVGAFSIATIMGIVVGVPIGLLARVRRVALPLLNAAFAVPIMVLIPLFLITLGLGIESKIAFGALYAFFPIVFNTISGTGNVAPIYFQVADAYGLSGLDRLRHIVLRSAARSILNGLQMGLAIAIIAVISIEMFGAVAGLGYLIHRAGQRMHIDEVYALILVVLAMAYLLLTAIRLVARLLGVRLEMSAF